MDVDLEMANEDSSEPDVPDQYGEVYANVPEETHMLKPVDNCEHCNAKKFESEPPGFCCRSGQVHLLTPIFVQGQLLSIISLRSRFCVNTTPDTPPELMRLCSSSNVDARHFCANIRYFNSHFSFTSLYCQLDRVTTTCETMEGKEPRHLELYFYNDDPSLEHRLRKCHEKSTQKDREVIQRMVDIFHGINPYSEHLRSMGQVDNLEDYHVALNLDQWLDQRTYNMPLMSEMWPGIFNPILYGKRLFQQFAVNTYVKIESSRLDYIRNKQDTLRADLKLGGSATADLYQGLVDSMRAGEGNADNVGRRTVLSPTFIGGPRNMRRRYMDAMALVRKFGKPDIFLTMICNPNWDEIKNELYPSQSAQDRLDLVTRVFKVKLEELKRRLMDKDILGKKRGLPHAHFLLIMQRKYKITCPEQHDLLISAELPNKKKYSDLCRMVMKHMMHGPCGTLNPLCPCTRGRTSCKNHPQPLYNSTSQGKDSYPIYRRRDDGRKERIRGHLQLRLLEMHMVTFYKWDTIERFVKRPGADESMLTAYFDYNRLHEEAHGILYHDFPKHYTWKSNGKFWKPRKNTVYQVGRLISAHPGEGERYFLWVILNNVARATSYKHLRTVDGVLLPSFREAAERRGLIKEDNTLNECLTENSLFQMSSSLRRLFVTILVFCEPNDRNNPNPSLVQQMVLIDIRNMLQFMGKDIRSFPLPEIYNAYDDTSGIPRGIFEEISIEQNSKDVGLYDSLNEEQRAAYDEILSKVDTEQGSLFFVDGPGGTGKTFLYRALLGTLRSQNKLVVATTTSGVATSIMPGGRTTHIFTKQSGTTKLLQQASLIIWDEASMTKRQAMKVLDNSLHNIMGWPGLQKTIVFVDASLRRSYLWESMRHLKLVRKMRAQSDPWFVDYLLRIGGGTEGVNGDGDVHLPDDISVPW
ncbi:hypothetical protein SETIT_3G225900v2 [Setaria italica]|uniref:ATP-dependent DNA helicase n=1 Tax=Setaria italica TaxID=4555 RepID=A0A368QHQ6_SETIT|nr:hypothetical protein SETIT_3G225900v2 [Setaria italica]